MRGAAYNRRRCRYCSCSCCCSCCVCICSSSLSTSFGDCCCGCFPGCDFLLLVVAAIATVDNNSVTVVVVVMVVGAMTVRSRLVLQPSCLSPQKTRGGGGGIVWIPAASRGGRRRVDATGIVVVAGVAPPCSNCSCDNDCREDDNEPWTCACCTRCIRHSDLAAWSASSLSGM